MAIGVESRVSTLPSVQRTLPVRPHRIAGSVEDSAQKNAQAFIDTLPSDVRDRVGQLFRDPKKRERFDQPERTSDDQPATRKATRDTGERGNVIEVDFQQPIYTQPILTPSAVLLQVQFADSEQTNGGQERLSLKEHEAFHAAYLSAGAQPGGRAEALAAQIAREEQAQKTLIVSPVPTSVNLSA